MKKIVVLLLVTLSFSMGHAQNSRRITGEVLDSAGNTPLAGATILQKGTARGTQTNSQGKFTLQVPAADTEVILLVEHVGYNPQELSAATDGPLQIRLSNNIAQMDEVVMIGYAAVKKRDLTGSVSSITSKQLRDIPVNSLAEALTGKLAGVQVTTSEGAPGADVQIKIRGNGSITQDGAPLYIVDGVQVEGGLSGLSPQDIESVDVLKDASATSIYGARGANGVVIITTKGGKEAKPVVSYNGFVGIKKLADKLEVLQPYDFVMLQYEKSRSTNEAQEAFRRIYGNWDSLDVYKSVPFIDWQDRTFGNDALMQTHNVGVSGGTKATQYNLSLTSNGEDGVMLNSGYNRKLVTFRMDTRVSDALKMGFNVRYTNQRINGAGTSDAGASTYNLLRHTVKYRPFMLNNLSPEDLDEAYYDETNAGNALGIINPIQLSDAQYSQKLNNITNLNGYANYNFNKQFSFKSTLGVNYNNQTYNTFYDYITSKARTQGASMPMVGVLTNNVYNLSNSNVLSFRNSRASDHRIDALLGNEFYNVKAKSTDLQLKNFPIGITPDKALNQLGVGTTVPTYPQSNSYESHIVSFFTRANYAYKDKFLANFSLRADGSSKFAPGRRWGYFPAGAVAWRLSKESFLENSKVISDLKLRVSYGATGNNRIDDYLFMNVFSPSAKYALNGQVVPAYMVGSLPNEKLKWETTVSRNIGLDLALFNNRLLLTADVYKNTVKNLLIDVPIPPTSGYTTQLQNVGNISNRGIELQLSGTPIQKPDFTWNAEFNIAFNRNRIERLAEGLDHYFAYSGFGISGQPADYIVKTGQPLGTMYGYVSDGFYGVNDFNYDAATGVYTLKEGVTDVSKAIGIAQPGWMKLKDLDGNHIIDDNDKTVIGDANPKFSGGLNQRFTYKQFDLGVFVNFVYGNKIYNANKIEFTNGYGSHTNSLAIMNDRWRTVDANGNVIQQVVTESGEQVVKGIAPDQLAAINQNAKLWIPISGAGAWYPTSWAMEDGSFLRINNITLGYTLPESLIRRIRLKSLRVYATVNNLAVLTGYSGYDPEVNTRRATPVTPGVDYSAYPRSKVYILGLNVSL
ncbi:SusC/RagA family TonB-linked outer membrane protein [Niabella beijingensis]|uniref:SusC/RagA family TonB-linked outer membrane protein n=1 Tax=Niabella beijingensis TaxID=2872700 RepID=UPI001CBCE7CC|nr:TonB-dependent receptor [Niabella beijingensis]MBZ4190050.1 TonB-dependent receptor [Niabella beijingensis]